MLFIFASFLMLQSQSEAGGIAIRAISPPAQSRDVSTAAAPRGNMAYWVTASDYPPLALVNNASGIVTYAATVGVDGRVTKCVVTETTTVQILNDATCHLIMRRGRFTPATDRNGNFVPSIYTNRIKWSLPFTPTDLDSEMKLYIGRAQSGDVGAMTAVGRINEIQKNYLDAELWYKKSAEAGDHYAMKSLADIYRNDRGSPDKWGISERLYERAALAGNLEAISIVERRRAQQAAIAAKKEEERQHLEWLKTAEGKRYTQKLAAEAAAAKEEEERRVKTCLAQNGFNNTRNAAVRAMIQRKCM